MSETKKKMYTSTMFMRPAINGIATPIPPGTPFDGDVLDDHTRECYIKVGTLKEYFPPIDVEAVDVEDAPVNEDAEAAPKKTRKRKQQEAPKGIFCLKVEDLVEKDLSELDAIHADVCAEAGLPAPDLFTCVEEAIEKLTSEG